MKLEIKVCGMTLPAQIRGIEGADFVGFIFASQSPRNALLLSPEQVYQTKIAKVGVFVNSDSETILGKVKDYNLSVVQLHGNETPQFCLNLSERLPEHVRIWKALPIAEPKDLEAEAMYRNSVHRILLDTKAPDNTCGGRGIAFNWNILHHFATQTPFMLAGGIRPEDAERLCRIKHPLLRGLDINSRFEISPGIKDIQKVNQFIETIHTYNTTQS